MTITPRRGFLGVITVLVVATVAAALWVTGSPQEARIRAFDNRRAQDLSTIYGMIAAHWSARQSLPASLDELSAAALGAALPADPETGAAYEYRVIDEGSYELCATFSRQSPATDENFGRAHAAGRQCFTQGLRVR
jgi:hypothetical protein